MGCCFDSIQRTQGKISRELSTYVEMDQKGQILSNVPPWLT
jgi:hypothetical protein